MGGQVMFGLETCGSRLVCLGFFRVIWHLWTVEGNDGGRKGGQRVDGALKGVEVVGRRH